MGAIVPASRNGRVEVSHPSSAKNGTKLKVSQVEKQVENNDSITLQDFYSLKHLISVSGWIESHYNDISPLQIGIIERNVDVVKALLEAGASPNFFKPVKQEHLLLKLKTGIKYFEEVEHYPPNFFNFEQEPSSIILEPLIVLQEQIKPSFELHSACKIGDIDNLLILLLNKIDPWIRDDFDNIAIYYSILHGHIICCAWLLVSMGGTGKFPLIERERFIINSLNLTIKSMLQDKLPPEDVIKNKEKYSHCATATDINSTTSVPDGEEDTGDLLTIGGLFGDTKGGDY
eukprot:gene3816-7598_t